MNYLGAGFILLSHDLNSVLLVHDARSSKWGFPKGHRELVDSSDLETAVRECVEETGYTADLYTVFPEVFKINKGSQSYLFRYARLNDHAPITAHSGNLREIDNVQWIPIKQLLEATNVLDGNKYLRTWITDIQTNATKKTVQLFKALLARCLPAQEPVSASNIVACA
jgi:8-oxo-dGTP pyrophosphatase MutT (NUDIX family)